MGDDDKHRFKANKVCGVAVPEKADRGGDALFALPEQKRHGQKIEEVKGKAGVALFLRFTAEFKADLAEFFKVGGETVGVRLKHRAAVKARIGEIIHIHHLAAETAEGRRLTDGVENAHAVVIGGVAVTAVAQLSFHAAALAVDAVKGVKECDIKISFIGFETAGADHFFLIEAEKFLFRPAEGQLVIVRFCFHSDHPPLL